jgi:hypothetical protein
MPVSTGGECAWDLEHDVEFPVDLRVGLLIIGARETREQLGQPVVR